MKIRHLLLTRIVIAIIASSCLAMTANATSIGDSKTYIQVKAKLQLDGVETSPSTTSVEGKPVTITVDGKSALWEITYTLTADHIEGVSVQDSLLRLEIEVKRDHIVIAQPTITTRNKTGASVKIGNDNSSADTKEMELRFEPHVISQ